MSAFIDRVVGASGGVAAAVVVATVVIGIACALAWRPGLAIVVASVAAIEYLDRIRHFAYGEQRAIEVAVPLGVITVAGGLERAPALFTRAVDGLARLVRARAAERDQAIRGAPLIGGAVILGLVATSIGVNLATTSAADAAPPRVVTPDYDAAARWMTSVGGSSVLVVDSDEFSETWLAYAARRVQGVAYPFMRRNESSGPPFGLWDGSRRRWAVVGRSEYVSAGAAVAGRAGQFSFVDLAAAPALVASPIDNAYVQEVDRIGPYHWFADDGVIMIVGRCPSWKAEVRVESLPAEGNLAIELITPAWSGNMTANPAGSDSTIPLEALGVTVLRLHNLRPAVTHPGDARLIALRVRSVECAPVAPPPRPPASPSPSRTRRRGRHATVG